MIWEYPYVYLYWSESPQVGTNDQAESKVLACSGLQRQYGKLSLRKREKLCKTALKDKDHTCSCPLSFVVSICFICYENTTFSQPSPVLTQNLKERENIFMGRTLFFIQFNQKDRSYWGIRTKSLSFRLFKNRFELSSIPFQPDNLPSEQSGKGVTFWGQLHLTDHLIEVCVSEER